MVDFDFKIIRRIGSKNSNADALSRRPQSRKRSDSNSVESNLDKYPFEVDENFKPVRTRQKVFIIMRVLFGWLVGWFHDKTSQAQKSDGHLFEVLDWIRAGARPPFKKFMKLSSKVRHYWSLFGEPLLIHQCLYRSLEDALAGTRLQLLVPKEMRPRALNELHDASHG